MAKKVLTQLVDDLDGTVLESGDGSTIRFGLEGRSYEIDLSDTNAEKLKAALAPFIAAGRSFSGGSKPARASRGAGRSDLQIIREWGQANGHTVGDRGRIPASVIEAYDAAH